MSKTDTASTRDFVYNVPSKVLFHPEITLLQIRIYAVIRSFMDTTGEAYASNNWIANQCGVKRNAAICGINALLKMGFIRKVTHKKQRYLEVIFSPIMVTDSTDSDEYINQSASIPKDTIKSFASIPKDTINQSASIPKDTQLDQKKKQYIYPECETVQNIDKPTIQPPEYQETLYQPHSNSENHGYPDEVVQSFAAFFSLYPVKKSRNQALAAWYAQGCVNRFEEIMMKLSQQVERDMQYISGFAVHPAKYIQQEKWNDDIQVRKQVERKTSRRRSENPDWHLDFNKDFFN